MSHIRITTTVAGLVLALLVSVATATGAAAATLTLTARAPRTVPFGTYVLVTGRAVLDPAAPAALRGAVVVVQERSGATWTPVAQGVLDTRHRYQVKLRPEVGPHTLRASIAATADHPAATSRTFGVTITPARPVLTLGVPTVTSETAFTLSATLRHPPGVLMTVAGRPVTLQVRSGSTWRTLGTPVTDAGGVARVSTLTWRGDTYRAVFQAADDFAGVTSASRAVVPLPLGTPVARPAGAPEPAVRFPGSAAPVGGGANATVVAIPNAVWTSMQGKSWQSGCLGRTSLRYVQVNYYGFDGYRYRGELVVRSDVAGLVASAFTDLYTTKYPIRLMVLPDHYGKNPRGPGANDYASMAADNTSAFNCRYVDGKEAQHVWSPHTTGRAIDLGTWENPYSSPIGPLPNSWYLSHRPTSSKAVLHATDAATRAFTGRGWAWGGNWSAKDYQHFER